ncbi:hypothetical protein F2Q70_00038378 [Brassica cretica]|nr:hypothetical protein F2Q70_00038378 [Brassica cretica]CAF2106546.1 unnamed protein product [Brassica napus]CDY40842.1 BnaC08g04760D [Brassica napus]
MNGTERAPSRSSVKHRPKVMAVKKHGPKKRGKPRKSADPKKFTMLPAKRTCARSQWVQTPFTEGKTNEIEEPKKKRKTKA